MSSTDIEPFITASLIDEFPDPQRLRVAVKERIEQAYAGALDERGQVHQPEDTYALHRRLQVTYEQLEAYERGFKSARQVIRQMQEEQLIDAVGEQDGIPASGLTIPTAGGDIVVKPDIENKNVIDPQQVRAVLAAQAARNINALVIEEHGNPDTGEGGMDETGLAELIDEAFGALIDSGKWEPQITKVKATADAFARAGDDPMAAVLRDTITRTRVYKDRVVAERKTPK